MPVEKPAHVLCRYCGKKMIEKSHFDYWNYECPVCKSGVAICKSTEAEMEKNYEEAWSGYVKEKPL